ncbi:hypothetical protein [Pseudanabaena yagii]|uniref:Uncharacterized protein n=1 Tax=Pseudanabaena yagii GIHE-NHR1 TaxID=2722753 RepID=A0ABX1LK91_9CYAN|nr:hypothetical protein [Pseudanabaena yagii]NMF56527.1 hypothetical protein [Pseudanabaena yagii GIHE-NHR1]
MKNTVVATLLAISGFAISGLALAAPVNAQTAIIAALYQNPSSPQTEVRYDNAKVDSNPIIIAVNTSPEVVTIAENLMFGDSYDRIVTMNHSDNIVCMVSGRGSTNGAVTCGLVDHE